MYNPYNQYTILFIIDLKNLMIMKDFITSMITLILFITAVGLFYVAITVTYPSVFINLVLVIISIFVLLQGCERLDKTYELGEYADDDDNVNNEEM